MQAREVIPAVLKSGNMSPVQVSAKLGRSKRFMGRYIYGKASTAPGLELTAEVMDAVGYDTLIRSRETGEEIIIDPPKRE